MNKPSKKTDYISQQSWKTVSGAEFNKTVSISPINHANSAAACLSWPDRSLTVTTPADKEADYKIVQRRQS